MSKLTFRLPSKAVQYGYAEIEIEHAGEATGHEVGVMYADLVKSFWEGEKGLKTPPLDQKAAEEMFEKELGATKVSEEKTEESPTDQSGKPSVESDPPWSKSRGASSPGKKPWENGAPDLFG